MYGDNKTIFLWNLRSSQIQTMSQQWREISTFTIDKYAHNIYLGNFKGQVICINRKKVNKNSYALIDKTVKVHKQYVMFIRKTQNKLVCISFQFQVCTLNLITHEVKQLFKVGEQVFPALTVVAKNSYILVKNKQKVHCFFLKDNFIKYRSLQDEENSKITQIPQNINVCYSVEESNKNVLKWFQLSNLMAE